MASPASAADDRNGADIDSDRALRTAEASGGLPAWEPATALADLRSLLNETEMLSNPAAYASVRGRSAIAGPGASISSVLGTSDPQAVGNFMRANRLTSDVLVLGGN